MVGNSEYGDGTAGFLDGGGITNKPLFGPSSLTLVSSVAVGNALSATPGVALNGGGLFTDSPVSTGGSVIAGNRPNQCVGS